MGLDKFKGVKASIKDDDIYTPYFKVDGKDCPVYFDWVDEKINETGDIGPAIVERWNLHEELKEEVGKLENRIKQLENGLALSRKWGISSENYSAQQAIAVSGWIDNGMKDEPPVTDCAFVQHDLNNSHQR